MDNVDEHAIALGVGGPNTMQADRIFTTAAKPAKGILARLSRVFGQQGSRPAAASLGRNTAGRSQTRPATGGVMQEFHLDSPGC